MASAHVPAGAGLTDGYITQVTSTTNAPAGGNYTFTNVAIGTPDASRRVVLGIAGRDTAAVPTSVTVGGTALTQDVFEANTPIASLYSEIIATGTTATIVVTVPLTQTYCTVGVWVVYGKSAVATASSPTNSTTPVANLTTQVGDFCIGMVAFRATIATLPAFTWTTATSRFDGPGDGFVRSRAGADYVATGTTTAMGGTVNFPFSTTESALVAAAYR